MGRPRLGKELKKPSDYSYDYPEQRELSKGLKSEDKKMIAELTGYSVRMIWFMCAGKRKMTKNVQEAVEKFVLINRSIEGLKDQIAV